MAVAGVGPVWCYHFVVLGIEMGFRFKYAFSCVISSINFDGNDGGKLYYQTRNTEDNGNTRFSVQVKTVKFPFRLEMNLEKLYL